MVSSWKSLPGLALHRLGSIRIPRRWKRDSALASIFGWPLLYFQTACSGTITTGALSFRFRLKLANSACGVGERLFCTLRTIWVKIGSAFVHEADHVSECGKVAQLDVLVARNAVSFADGSHDLCLLHSVDSQIRFEIEIQVKHVDGIASFFGYQSQYPLFHGIALGVRL